MILISTSSKHTCIHPTANILVPVGSISPTKRIMSTGGKIKARPRGEAMAIKIQKGPSVVENIQISISNSSQLTIRAKSLLRRFQMPG
jgi:hypothetical protein